MHVNILRDDVMRNLTLSEKGVWLELMADSAEQERDGRYIASGRVPKQISTLVTKGVLIATEEPGVFLIHGADRCIKSRAEMTKKRDDAKARKERWRERDGTRSEHVPERVRNTEKSAFRSNSPLSLLSSPSEVGVEGSQLQPSRRRDESYEAFGDCWQGAWRGLPSDARGRINKALASLRAMTENGSVSDAELAVEIRLRWARAERWQPEWTWTPQTCLDYWRKLDREPLEKRSSNDNAARLRGIATDARNYENGVRGVEDEGA